MAEKLGRIFWGYSDSGVRRERLVIKCDCGQEVICSGFTNTCNCERDYNMSGDLLAPRAQWGDDTGESVSDILMADSDY